MTDHAAAHPGDEVRLAFVSAETFAISESATDPERVAEWIVLDRSGERTTLPAPRIDELELVASWRPQRPGMHVAALALNPRFIELSGLTFRSYLTDENATAALAELRERGAEKEPGREIYSKLGKTFVVVGHPRAPGGGVPGDTTYREPVGHTLEIIPLSDPTTWNAGDEVLVRVLFEGKPKEGLRVSSGYEGLPRHTYAQHVMTDADGVARITLGDAGHWFLRTHLIRRIDPKRGPTPPTTAGAPSTFPREDADWESFWASITFRVAG